MIRDDIIEAARVAHRRFWRSTTDESAGDKQAVAVTLAWQKSVASKDVKCEVPIEENLNEKIDVIDFSTATAYELKASGKNAGHEFYKDIFKILVYNQHHDRKLERLVFITEKKGIARLSKGLGKAVLESVASYNIDITLIAL